MSEVDTSVEAVERNSHWLTAAARGFDLPAAARDVLENSAALLRALRAERDAALNAERGEAMIVSRIWQMLGSPSYEQLAGRSIYDCINELKTERDAAQAERDRLRSEIAAREAAAAAAMRDAREEACLLISALPLPGADALAAALREAEKRGIERAILEAEALPPPATRMRAVAAIRALLEDRAAQEPQR